MLQKRSYSLLDGSSNHPPEEDRAASSLRADRSDSTDYRVYASDGGQAGRVPLRRAWRQRRADNATVRAAGTEGGREHWSRSGKILPAFAAANEGVLNYRRTGNLRAVQLPLGHSKIESTVRYLGPTTRSKSLRRSISERLTLYHRYRTWAAALNVSPDQNHTAANGTNPPPWQR